MLHRAVERIITSSTPHPWKHTGFLFSLQNLHNLTPVQCFKPLLHQAFCFLDMLCICVLMPMWFSFCTLSPLARLIALYVYSNRSFKICISIYYIAWSLSQSLCGPSGPPYQMFEGKLVLLYVLIALHSVMLKEQP